nr:MAG TPA_asm: hypothetical protein [Caudoviricetes sp.]
MTSTNSPDILYDCCGEQKQQGFLKRNSKKVKKCLTRTVCSDKLLNCCCE